VARTVKVVPVEISWHSDLSIYASEAYLRTVSDEYGWLGGSDGLGRLQCVLPYSIMRKGVFRLVRFPVQTISLGTGFDIDEERKFLNEAVEYFRLIGSDLIIPATFNTLFRTYPDGAVIAPYGSYLLDLQQSEEALWKNLHQKHRNVIRSAGKKGVRILSGKEHLETAYRLMLDSLGRSAQSFIAKMRARLRRDYGAFRDQVLALGGNVMVFVAEHEGVVQSCAVIPFSSHSAYYMHGGSISSPLTGASNLLQWEAIRELRELGVRYYDFFGARIDPVKGSKAEGISKFKERFGGRLKVGYMWKMPLRPWKTRLYSLAVRLRSGGDVVDQEGYKLKHCCPS